jgi:iron complex outermembrane recepter protein
MKSAICGARLSVLSLALCGVFSASAQTASSGVLKEVVVTASGFAESADKLAYGVSVISAKDIEGSGAASVGEAIMKLLGVPGRLDLSGANSYALDLRGFGQTASSNQVVMVDGRRLSVQDLSSDGLGDIPIDQVQRIEVIRGSAAVLFGEGATAGAIVVTTKAGMGVERHNAALLSATTGSNGLQEYRSSATVVNGGFSLDVFGTDRKQDGHRDNFASVNNNIGATVQWSNDWLRLGAQSSRSMGHSGLPGGLDEARYAANPRQADTPGDYGQTKNEVSGAFLEAFAGDWQLGLDLGQRTRKIETYYAAYTSFSTSSIDTNTANVRARHSFSTASYANALTLGVDNEHWTFLDYAQRKGKADSTGIYVNDDISLLGSGTRLSLGLRSETIEKTRAKAASSVAISESPSAWNAGLTQDLGANAQLFGRMGQSFRLANVDEINYVTPGSMLVPQVARDVELGARWHQDASRVELRLYQSDVSNEIAFDDSAIGPSSIFGQDGANVNLAPTVHRGVELDGHHQLTGSMALRMSAAARQAHFSSGPYAGNSIALVPGQTFAVGLEVKPAAGHTVDLALTQVSSQYVDFANQCSMPAYNTLDARYAYSVKALEFVLGVSNLTDAKYYTQAYKCTAGVIQSIYPEAGRAVTASLKLKF